MVNFAMDRNLYYRSRGKYEINHCDLFTMITNILIHSETPQINLSILIVHETIFLFRK
jgi:hypothetical protein